MILCRAPVCSPILAGYRGCVFVNRVGPDWTSFRRPRSSADESARLRDGHLGPVEFVLSSPPAPLGMFRLTQTVGNQREPRRRVAFHAVRNIRIRRTERTMSFLNMLRNPLVADRQVVNPWYEGIDAYPSGRAVITARTNNVEKVRELLPDPW